MAALCMSVFCLDRRNCWYFILPAGCLTALLLSYNFAVFGSWKGGDIVMHSLHWELDRVRGDSWSTPLATGLAGQLISPSRGLLIFSPFLLFAFWGMIAIWRKTSRTWKLIALSIPGPVLMLIVFSKYIVWWGGNSHYGPRYQIETYPFLILYLAAVWPKIASKRGFLHPLFIPFGRSHRHSMDWSLLLSRWMDRRTGRIV